MSPLKLSNPFRRGADRPTLKKRAADLKVGLSHHVGNARSVAEPDRAPVEGGDDAELLRLGHQFEAARKRETAACEACNAAEREADRHMPERPACLIYRASDARLSVHQNWMMPEALQGREVRSSDIEWLRRKMPMTHEILRPIHLGERSHIDHPGRRFDIVLHPEAQARAEEIMAAWDGWCAAKATVGMQHDQSELDAEAEAAGDATSAIAHRIAELPARTAAGFRVKIRALAHYNVSFFRNTLPELPDPDQALSHSLWLDVQGEERPASEPVDWHNPPPGFMASPAIKPFGFARIPDAIGLELDRLHGIAVAEFKRRGGPEKSEAEQSALRRELHLDELNYVPPRENGEMPKPAIDTLSGQILALWPAWAAHTGDDGTDEQTAAYEAMQQRRFALLHAADALPATPDSIQPKALALAWLHYVDEWRQGQKRDDYSTDARLAIDIHMAALAQPGQTPLTVIRQEPDLVGMLDFTSASMEDLRAVHDVADLVGSVAYATTWQGRCKMRGYGDEANAAGKLMQWLGDALTDVETATSAEAARRLPGNSSDRGRHLSIWAASVIDNDDPKSIEAFAWELLAHAEAERAGR